MNMTFLGVAGVSLGFLALTLRLMRENEEVRQFERLRETASRQQSRDDSSAPEPRRPSDLVTREERLKNHPQYTRARPS